MSKTLLFLGASPTQLPPIYYALEAGYRVITVDNRPDNPGHQLAHQWFDVSTTDQAGILALAQTLEIDGILGFGSEPAAPTVAYVASQLGLPGNPIEAVLSLSYKNRFRALLKQMGLPAPDFFIPPSLAEAQQFLAKQSGDWLLKPIDASGSKGILRLKSKPPLTKTQWKKSLCYSRQQTLILERYIQRQGAQIHGEGFVVKGQLVFCLLGEVYFTVCNPLLPYSTLVPSQHPAPLIQSCIDDVAQVIQKAGYWQGGLNIEILVTPNQQLHLLEISPRSGGSYMAKWAAYASGVDLVKANVETALGHPLDWPTTLPKLGPPWYVLLDPYSEKAGYLQRLTLPEKLQTCIVESHLFYPLNTWVPALEHSGHILGSYMLHLPDLATRNIYLEYVQRGEIVQVSSVPD